MDQPYIMDPVDHKQNPGPPMRRGYYGDDHELFRQNNALDLKYPFPQAHLFPPSSSVRGGPMKNPGTFPSDAPGAQENHITDPRYVPQDFVSSVREMDDKRYKAQFGFPSANGQTAASGINLYNSSGAGATSFNGLMIPPPPAQNKAKDNAGLVTPIPPLHVQHENSRKEDVELNENSEDAIHSKCSRCKKDFVQRLVAPQETGKGKNNEPKIFKLCFHCRDLQRQRSRRWQKKTKDKQGACRRCGSEIPVDQQKFVLCPQCRKSLRIRKANRAAQGRCVHCSGPIASSIVKDDSPDNESSEDAESRRASVAGSFKVCQRCRENDKIRRTNLERMGNCNRCAKALTPEEQGKHKVCLNCRQKKKKSGNPTGFPPETMEQTAPVPQMTLAQNLSILQAPQQLQPPHQLQSTQTLHGPPGQQGPLMHEMAQNVIVPSMNFVPMEQNTMLVHPGMNNYGGVGVSMPQQEMPMGYGQQMQPVLQGSGEIYKPPMTQLPQLQPHMDSGYQQYIGYPPVNRNGLHYSGGRM